NEKEKLTEQIKQALWDLESFFRPSLYTEMLKNPRVIGVKNSSVFPFFPRVISCSCPAERRSDQALYYFPQEDFPKQDVL
ncbi:hypothetical protein, partial [Streptococcus pseudopneumoniae]